MDLCNGIIFYEDKYKLIEGNIIVDPSLQSDDIYNSLAKGEFEGMFHHYFLFMVEKSVKRKLKLNLANHESASLCIN